MTNAVFDVDIKYISTRAKEFGLTQNEIAKTINSTVPTISRIVTRKNKPSKATWYKISKLLMLNYWTGEPIDIDTITLSIQHYIISEHLKEYQIKDEEYTTYIINDELYQKLSEKAYELLWDDIFNKTNVFTLYNKTLYFSIEWKKLEPEIREKEDFEKRQIKIISQEPLFKGSVNFNNISYNWYVYNDNEIPYLYINSGKHDLATAFRINIISLLDMNKNKIGIKLYGENWIYKYLENKVNKEKESLIKEGNHHEGFSTYTEILLKELKGHENK